MIKYILCFISGVVVCLIFMYYTTLSPHKMETTSITIDTIYIERDVHPVTFTATGKLDTSKSSPLIKTDTTGKIVLVDNIISDTTHMEFVSVSSGIDKYILPEFIVYFDTVIYKDTFGLQYEFPNNLFHFNFAHTKIQ